MEGEALFTYYHSFCMTATLEVSVSSDSNVDCDSCGDYSEVDSWSRDDSVRDSYAEDERAKRMDYAQRVLSECCAEHIPSLSISAVEKRAG